MVIEGYFRCKMMHLPGQFLFFLHKLCRASDGKLQWNYDDECFDKLPDGSLLIRDLTPEEGKQGIHDPIPYKDTDLENLIIED